MSGETHPETAVATPRAAGGDERQARRDRVSGYWGDHVFTDTLARIHWMASPVVGAYLNRLASGHPEGDWLTRALRHPRLRRGELGRRAKRSGWRLLVLGCGSGWLERTIAGRAEIASIDACDVAEGAVATARAEAERLGLAGKLRYHVVDLDHEPPPGGPYDVVLAHSVLHHVENLELAYPALAGVLAPHGVLVVNEYVGPRRFQFTDAQMAVINDVLARLPERYRRSVMMPGAVFPHKEVPTVEQMIAVDPSESVRSDELLAFSRRHFHVLEERPYGGTVLQQLLYDVVHNFDPADVGDVRVLGLLCLLEEALLREGVLPSDYALLLAEAKGAGEADGQIAGGVVGGEEGDEVGAGLWLQPPQPAPGAVPVRRVVEISAGVLPAVGGEGAAERHRVHSRPLRDRRHGIGLEPVARHLHRLATGDPDCDWASRVLGDVLPERGVDAARALVLAGADGWLAAAVAASPRVETVDRLRVEVEDDGEWHARYLLAGTDEDSTVDSGGVSELEAGAYDLIFTNGFLGQAPDRPGLAGHLARCLVPGGLLIGDEWIGPADGRTTPRTLAYARQLGELLQPLDAPPASLRDLLRAGLVDLEHGWYRRRFGPPERDLAEILGPDLELLVERGTGGALLQRVLAPGLEVERFAPPGVSGKDSLTAATEARDAFVAVAAYLEERLTAAGALADEYACFIARRR